MAKTTTTTTEEKTPMTLEEMEKYFAEREKELDERQQALAAKEKVIAAKQTAAAEKPAEDLSDLKRRVKVQLPLDSQHKEPLPVRVNDYTYIIQRGKTVEVPYFVYLAIKENQDADAKTLMLLDDLNRKFTSKAEEYRV